MEGAGSGFNMVNILSLLLGHRAAPLSDPKLLCKDPDPQIQALWAHENVVFKGILQSACPKP